MLQQTQVARVVAKYGEFLDRFPTLESIAAARARQVHEAWDGLGYYARARHLHALARHVVRGERRRGGRAGGSLDGATLPDTIVALRALPGIGRYTAGAVASFAFERAAPIVDTNVARVLTRVFAPELDPRTPRARRAAWDLATALLPRSGRIAYVHNQALMELGALVCRPRKPRCRECPVRSLCKTGGRLTPGP